MTAETGGADRSVDQGRYDGVEASALGESLHVPLLVALATTTSVLDDSHRMAADGAPSGAVIVAEEQTAGRGRGGKRWTSRREGGVWFALLHRASAGSTLELLSIRLALAGAAALDPFAGAEVQVKWPNDLWVAGGKLAGILVEARWRDGVPDWLAVGVGVNVVPPPEEPRAAGLPLATSRVTVLKALVPALQRALLAGGELSAAEARELWRRDLSRGRHVREPFVGVSEGISRTGELLVRTAQGSLERCRSGSLVFKEGA